MYTSLTFTQYLHRIQDIKDGKESFKTKCLNIKQKIKIIKHVKNGDKLKDMAKVYDVCIKKNCENVKMYADKLQTQKQFNISSECISVLEFWKRHTIRDAIFNTAFYWTTISSETMKLVKINSNRG